MDRRALLKMAATGTAAAALTGAPYSNSNADPSSDLSQSGSHHRTIVISSPGTSGREYGQALDRLLVYAEDQLRTTDAPGMTLSVVGEDGFAAIVTIGWADSDRRLHVNPSHLFQIGSISKSFGALCVHRLADEGKIDLDAPLARYLPDLPLPEEPVLVRQILSHTSGLPRSSPVFPVVPDQRLWTGFKPGAAFSYSNTGYAILGILVERITGKPYPNALRELVIEPLGITGLRESIQANDRALYAVGYSPLDASGANMPRVTLGQTPWLNCDTAEGNIGTTAGAMVRYLQFLVAVGRGRGTPLFSDAAAKRFSTVVEPAADGAFGKGTGYASGLAIIDLDGHTAFQHPGTICGFTSSITVDPVAGVGCFASMNVYNGGYGANKVTEYACRLLRRVKDGGTELSPFEDKSSHAVETAEAYSGTYIAPDGDRFEIVARSGSLFLEADGREGRMQPMGENGFLSSHSRYGSHFFDFERSAGAVTAVWYGSVLFGRGRAVLQPPVPPDLALLQGTYVSSDPWSGWWRTVVAQGDRLLIENIAIYGSKDSLRREGDFWRPENANNKCDRIRFDALLNGVPQRLNVSGRDLLRFNEL